MTHSQKDSQLDSQWDVVLLGETMLRLTPPGLRRMELATNMDVHVGGSESNMAVGLARLGHRVAWISRLTENPLGRTIERSIAQHGVDTQFVAWTDQDRVGLYFLEEGKAPRGSQVLYDRAASAASRIRPEDLPIQVFQPRRSRWFHTSGITLAIGEGARSTAMEGASKAKSMGWQVSFDLNYRAKLWSVAEARSICQPIMQLADLLFIAERDARAFYGWQGDSLEQDFERLASIFPDATIVVTMGKEGSAAWDGVCHRQGIFFSDAIERLGGGDAFAAGFLSATLEGADVPTALRWGAATASLKYSIPGDLPLISRSEVMQLLSQSSSAGIQR